jgi:hypothetical protein
MILPRHLFAFAAAVTLCASGPAARAELAAWDQQKVAALAQQLSKAASELYDTFYKQPVATAGSGQARSYYRLKQLVRHIRSEAGELAASLEKGTGYDETLPMYEDLMQTVRDARDEIRQTFTGIDVQEKASAARAILNQISPYYDPDFQPLQPATR